MSEPGLRARSKARRRLAITEAALTLFADNGYEQTTVADIAAAAEVAPRTVALYFPTKQDIALGSFSESAERLGVALQERDPSTPALMIVRQWLIDEEESPDDDCDSVLYARMFAANPEVAALRTARMAAAMDVFARAIAMDMGAEPSSAAVQVTATAIAAVVMHVATQEEGPKREAAKVAAFEFLDGGMRAVGDPDRT